MKVPRGARCPTHGPQTEAVALQQGGVLVRYCPQDGCSERLEGAPDLEPFRRRVVTRRRGSKERKTAWRS